MVAPCSKTLKTFWKIILISTAPFQKVKQNRKISKDLHLFSDFKPLYLRRNVIFHYYSIIISTFKNFQRNFLYRNFTNTIVYPISVKITRALHTITINNAPLNWNCTSGNRICISKNCWNEYLNPRIYIFWTIIIEKRICRFHPRQFEKLTCVQWQKMNFWATRPMYVAWNL